MVEYQVLSEEEQTEMREGMLRSIEGDHFRLTLARPALQAELQAASAEDKPAAKAALDDNERHIRRLERQRDKIAAP